MSDPIIPVIQEQLYFFKKGHDINRGLQGPWKFLVELDTGLTMATASVVLVDANEAAVPFDSTGVAGDSLVLTFDHLELDTTQQRPNVWAVYFKTQHGNAQPFGTTDPFWRIQCNYTDSAGFDDDCLMLLLPRK